MISRDTFDWKISGFRREILRLILAYNKDHSIPNRSHEVIREYLGPNGIEDSVRLFQTYLQGLVSDDILQSLTQESAMLMCENFSGSVLDLIDDLEWKHYLKDSVKDAKVHSLDQEQDKKGKDNEVQD